MKRNQKQLFNALIFVIVIMQCFSSTLARAQSAYMDKIDADKDGFISIKEAVSDPYLLAEFGKIDRNGDGKISLKELKAAEYIKQ